MKLCWNVFLFMALMPVFSLQAQTKSAVETDMKSAFEPRLIQLEENLKDWTRIYYGVMEITDEEVISSKTFLLRVLFTKVLDYGGESGNAYLINGSTPVPIDNIDLVMIKKGSPFKLEAALKKDVMSSIFGKKQPISKKDFYYRMYGITWSQTKAEAHPFTVYLGSDDSFYYFARTNIFILDWLTKELKLKDGYDKRELLVDALAVTDDNFFSSGYASDIIIPEKDNKYIRPIIASARHMAQYDNEPPIAHMRVLLGMGTKESVQSAADLLEENSDVNILNAVSALVESTKLNKELKPVYFELLRLHKNVSYLSDAVFAFNWQDEALPIYQRIAAKPENFGEYFFSTSVITIITRPNKADLLIQREVMENIQLLAIRSGEIPGTAQYIHIPENEMTEAQKVAQRAELNKEDRIRLGPFEKALIDAPEKDFSVATGIALAIFNQDDPRVNMDYVKRVRMSGINVLQGLPRVLVEKHFNVLKRNIENEDELYRIEAAYNLYRERIRNSPQVR